MKKLLPITLSVLFLSACKTEVEKEVSLSKLLNDPISVENAVLNVEVAGCNDFQDSRQPSQSLLDAQQKVPFVFTNATFKECYRQNFNSYAVFEIPIGVGVITEETQKNSLPEINLFSFKHENKSLPLGVMIKEGLKQRLNKLQKTEIMANAVDFSVVLKVKNDLTDKNKNFRIVSSYVNNTPYPDGIDLDLEKTTNKSIEIKLSNVSIDSLLKTEGDGLIAVIKSKKATE